MAVILDIGIEWFSNSESPFHADVSHQVSAQPDLLFGRRYDVKNLKMVTILDIGKKRILAILNVHNTLMPPIMFKLNQTSVADVI